MIANRFEIIVDRVKDKNIITIKFVDYRMSYFLVTFLSSFFSFNFVMIGYIARTYRQFPSIENNCACKGEFVYSNNCD